ncbi:E3 ubiquitin-protein ligase TRAIP [Nymphon striatum]|nr:E3 ubiquitin-protein ligase TRAIP [Nymphon striatum]
MYCSICFDHFESSSNIAATPCGHTFHDVCLFRWLNSSSSRTSNCPKCRFRLERKDCVQKLYFDVYDEQEDYFTLKSKISNLEISLKNKDVEIKKLVQNETASKVELHKLQEANCDLESKVKTMNIEISANAELRKEYEELKVEITLYKQIKSAVSSSCEDIDLMFKSFSTKNGLKNKAIICTMMKRKLMKMKKGNKEMKKKYNVTMMKRKLMKMKKGNKEMKKKYNVTMMKRKLMKMKKGNKEMKKKYNVTMMKRKLMKMKKGNKEMKKKYNEILQKNISLLKEHDNLKVSCKKFKEGILSAINEFSRLSSEY